MLWIYFGLAWFSAIITVIQEMLNSKIEEKQTEVVEIKSHTVNEGQVA